MSITKEIDDVQEALYNLCRSIERTTRNSELKAEYVTLCHQATTAIRNLRSISETDEFLKTGNVKRFLDTAGGQ